MQNSKETQSKPKYRIAFGEVTSKNRKVLKILNDSSLPIKYSQNFYLFIEHGQRFAKLVYYKDVPIAAISWKIDRASEHTQQKQNQRLINVQQQKKKKEQEELKKSQDPNYQKPEKQEEDQQKKQEDQQKKQEEEQQVLKGKSGKSKRKQKQKAKQAAENQKEIDDPNDQKLVYMMTITVLQSYRKMGFGEQILKMSEDLWRQQGYKTIILDVQTSNEPAINFYKKHGFQLIREKPYYYSDLQPPHSLFFKKALF